MCIIVVMRIWLDVHRLAGNRCIIIIFILKSCKTCIKFLHDDVIIISFLLKNYAVRVGKLFHLWLTADIPQNEKVFCLLYSLIATSEGK